MISRGEIRRQPFDEIVEQTVQTRGIPLDHPVDARIVTQAELPDLLTRIILAETSESELQSYQWALNAVGLWPSGRDLLDEYLAVLGEEMAGFYLPPERALYLVADAEMPFTVRFFSSLLRRDLAMEMTLSHEVVHLLQHQAYPQLFEPDPFYENHDDLGFAIQAAYEGDATLYGIMAMGLPSRPSPEEMEESLESEMTSQSGGRLANSPALIRLTLVFPYASGYRLAYREGLGLLEHPPASTEQVLHPQDKRHEAFLALDLRPVQAALPSQCRFLHANTMGELGLSVLFRDLAETTSAEVWEGWDGDRYLVAECGERREFVWIAAWDSERDAAEFEAAYRGIAAAVAKRAGLPAPPEIRRIEREVHVTTGGLAELRDSLAALSRRERVSEMEALRRHFEADSPEHVAAE